METVAVYLQQLGQISLADLFPLIAMSCLLATFALRFIPQPHADSSSGYVAFYSTLHFAANFSAYLHQPQFAPENLTATFTRFTTMMGQFSATMDQVGALIPLPQPQPAPVLTTAPPSPATGTEIPSTATSAVAMLLILALSGLAACANPTIATTISNDIAAVGTTAKVIDQSACTNLAPLVPTVNADGVAIATLTGQGATATLAAGVGQTLSNINCSTIGATPPPAAVTSSSVAVVPTSTN